ncbi:MAG: AsmA-like C-terminal domain-containing protein [Desulfobacterota bacterium]|nr:AsmA-like C-terminal domain-containing protein [Thermodesulfobacteriota bacterium]
MTRKFFSFIWSCAAVCAICFALLVVGLSYIARDLPYYVRMFLKTYEETVGVRILFDDIDWSITSGSGVRIFNLTIFDPIAQIHLLTCDSITIQSSLSALFKKRFTISRIVLEQPRITLYKHDGGVQIPLKSLLSTNIRNAKGIMPLSISLNKMILKNATIRIVDPRTGQSLDIEPITSMFERKRKTQRYYVSGNIPGTGRNTPARLHYSGSIWFAGKHPTFHTLSGDVSVSLHDIPCAPWISFFSILPPKISLDGKVSGTLSFALSPDHAITISCNLTSHDIVYTHDNKTSSVGPLALSMHTSVQPPGNGSGEINITAGTLPSITVKALLSRSQTIPGFDLVLQAMPLRCAVPDLMRYLSLWVLTSQRWHELSSRVERGIVNINSLQAHMGFHDNATMRYLDYNAALSFDHIVARLHPSLPPIKIATGTASVASSGIAATMNATFFDNDTHHISITIPRTFDTVTGEVHSVLPASSIAAISSVNPLSRFSETFGADNGTVAVHTVASLSPSSKKGHIDMQIDATNLSYRIGPFAKPESIPSRFSLSSPLSFNNAPSTPLLITASSGTTASVVALVIPDPKPFIFGSYHFSYFMIPDDVMPILPHGIRIDGCISGSGLFAAPCRTASKVPAYGTFILHNAALGSSLTGENFIGSSCFALLSPHGVSVLNGKAHIGATSGSIGGLLTSLNPPHGKLRIDAQLFDIDDFLSIVQKIISLPFSSDPPFMGQQSDEANPFFRTNLLMDFTVNRLHVMDWDFTDGIARYTYRNGVMRWEDITIHGGGGTVNGYVEYDFSDFSNRSLTLAPSRSNVDVSWAIPGIRKKQIMTGTLDLRGIFTSRFSQKKDLGINMCASFDATVVNGVIQKFTILSKILSLMNITQLAQLKPPDIFEKGMPFDSICAQFILEKGQMKTENLIVRGPAMNLSAVGTIDLRDNTIDLIVGAQVLSSISNVIGNIPFAGELVTGKDKSLTLGYFRVQGPYHEASVTPMPIKSLSGPILKIFRTVFDIPRDLLSPGHDNATHPY